MGKSFRTCGILLLASLSLASSALAQMGGPARATIRGRVLDSQSREPVGQAEVVIIRTGPRALTEDDGRFVLEGVAAGPCTLSVTRMGFAPLRRELTVAEGAVLNLDLQLLRTAVPLAEITVTPGSFSFMGQGTGTRQTMSREEVQAVPQIGEDIFRAANRLPGLVSNDNSTHVCIRGGRPHEKLILLVA